ncbi:hypothetical protein [Leucobacter triazinivorans]|uniref:Uncharacterized protein n=1 Tax=Leucobacter triazinivorans TaxID=1784719 RepID=A0A4P6KF72_9MICO|nr:hypothetical protein [Leucobacter triazinivorans]QBE48588.1 hypothetical protein EVS81_06880 [Leucobacter triazinivorans]
MVPYWGMPSSRAGRVLWIGLTAAIVLAFTALGVAILVVTLAGAAEPAGASDAAMPWIVALLCGGGAAVFGWLLADGLRRVARDRVERRRTAEKLAQAEARIRRLRDPGS